MSDQQRRAATILKIDIVLYGSYIKISVRSVWIVINLMSAIHENTDVMETDLIEMVS